MAGTRRRAFICWGLVVALMGPPCMAETGTQPIPPSEPIPSQLVVPAQYSNDDLLRLPRSRLYRRFFTTIPLDLEEITLAPFRYPTWSAWFFGGSALLILIDKPMTQVWQDVVETNLTFDLPSLLDTPITQRSDGYLLFGLGAFYLGSLAVGDKRGEVAVALSVKSIAYSFLYSHIILKTLFARNRPHHRLGDPSTYVDPFTDNQFDFFNFHAPYLAANPDGTSFPSFHWTMFFSVSRILQRVYDSYWPYLITAVGLGVDTAFQRHWVSDMFAGGVFGVLIADVVYDNYMGITGSNKAGFFADATVLPTALPGGMGVYFAKRF